MNINQVSGIPRSRTDKYDEMTEVGRKLTLRGARRIFYISIFRKFKQDQDTDPHPVPGLNVFANMGPLLTCAAGPCGAPSKQYGILELIPRDVRCPCWSLFKQVISYADKESQQLKFLRK